MADSSPLDFLAPRPDADWAEVSRCARAWIGALPADWERLLDAGELQVPEWVLDYGGEMMEAETALLLGDDGLPL